MLNRTQKTHFLSLLGLGFFIFIAFGSVKDDTTPEEVEAATQVITNHYSNLSAINQLITVTDLKNWESRECSKAMMAEGLAQDEGDLIHLTPFYFPFLERFTSGTETAWNKSMGEWQWLTQENVVEHYGRVENLRPFEVKSLGTFWIPNVKEERYAVVFFPTSVEANSYPSIADDGENFSGGLYLGWFLVVDLIEPEIICRDVIVAGNSDQVRRGLNNTMELAVTRDFKDNFEKAVTEKLPDGVLISW